MLSRELLGNPMMGSIDKSARGSIKVKSVVKAPKPNIVGGATKNFPYSKDFMKQKLEAGVKELENVRGNIGKMKVPVLTK